jgi:hypothetical protein
LEKIGKEEPFVRTQKIKPARICEELGDKACEELRKLNWTRNKERLSVE